MKQQKSSVNLTNVYKKMITTSIKLYSISPEGEKQKQLEAIFSEMEMYGTYVESMTELECMNKSLNKEVEILKELINRKEK